MGVLGQGEAERLEDECLADSVGEVLLRTGDRGDAHHRVVHSHAEVVHRHAVGAQQDEVAQSGLDVPRDPPTDHVVDGDNLALRNLEAVREGLASIHALLHFSRVGVAPRAVIRNGAAAFLSRLALGLELLLRAEARVRVPHLHQLLGQRDIHLATLRLAVVAGGASDERTLVPLQAQPLEVTNHALLALLRAARKVGVLYPKHKPSAGLLCREVTVQRSARAAHVQRPCRRRCEAKPCQIAGHNLQTQLLEDVRIHGRHFQRHQPRPPASHTVRPKPGCPLVDAGNAQMRSQAAGTWSCREPHHLPRAPEPEGHGKERGRPSSRHRLCLGPGR